MGAGKLFTDSMQVLKRSLDVRLLKHFLVTGNLANAEVPGFKSKDVSFKDAMRKAGEAAGIELARSNSRHLGASDAANLYARVVESPRAGVDIDQEMVKLSENNLMYQASIQLLAKKIEGIRSAIEGGR